VISIGTDILEIQRIEQTLGRLGDRFVQRILTSAEQLEYHASGNGARLLARRFAAKEAVAKALGSGIGRGVSWQDIHISHDPAGAPLVNLTGGAHATAVARGGTRMLLSLSDEQHYVVAFAALSE
jgi:holo-[acyl-carrier protein] synthase